MKSIFSIVIAFVLAFAGWEVQAQISDINVAVNKAGRQRMLSQRIAKAYFQVGQQVEADRSKKVLDSSVAIFDRQLVELKNYAPNPEIKTTYLKLETAWLAYKDALLGAKPSPETGRKVLDLSEQVLSLAHQGTVQFEKLSGTNAARLVNLSGRQRMLSQRMAKFYQAKAWGIADDRSTAQFEAARKEFNEALQELTNAPANTQQIKESLDLVKQQWFFFENALGQKSGPDKRPQTAVATTSERILEEMEGVVGLYEKMPK